MLAASLRARLRLAANHDGRPGNTSARGVEFLHLPRNEPVGQAREVAVEAEQPPCLPAENRLGAVGADRVDYLRCQVLRRHPLLETQVGLAVVAQPVLLEAAF